jgi:serine/threonine protein kinase/Tfp pilus assembly protein PilF
MNAEKWGRIQDLFYQADDLPVSERAKFLDEVCQDDPELRREVESLLDTAASDPGRVEESVSAAAGQLLARDLASSLSAIGPYAIIRPLGEGGMGVVYLARRADDAYEQTVAIKVIRPAYSVRDAMARFRAERQILANLAHPNIARLLDGGVTANGQPYLVMEYVEGQPIDVFCKARVLGLRATLELFRAVCAGVQCAHQNLIVHRDIKPGNILVDASGTPKLLDFGVAKLLDAPVDANAPATRMMTPEYASPEQILGRPVTTAADVYGLGVLLYELISGRRPYIAKTKSAGEWERLVCESDPPRPSSVAAVDADIETIILKAMHKESARRYATAAELAEDIRRYLTGFPIAARPDSVGYRASKFIQRHRFGVLTATLAAVCLIGFGVAMGVLARRAETERHRSEQVSSFLVNLFSAANPDRMGKKELTTRDMVDQGVKDVDKLAGQPEVQTSLLDTFGLVYESLGAWDQSRALLTRSIAIKRRIYPAGSLQIADAAKNLAELCRRQFAYAEAESLSLESVRIRVEKLGANHGLTLESQNTLALVYQGTGRLREAEQLFLKVLQQRDTLRTHNHLETAVLSNIGAVYGELGDFASAERYLRECVTIRRERLGPNHPRLALALARLGNVLSDVGKLGEADAALRESLAIREKLFGPQHRDVARALLAIAEVARKQGQFRPAAEALARVRQMPMTSDELADLLMQEGQLQEASGDRARAISTFRECLAIRTKLFGPSHRSVERARAALTHAEALVAAPPRRP